MPRTTSKATASERSLAAKLAAHCRWANNDPVEGTDAARRAGPGQGAYWERQVDPDGKLSLAERARRADSAKRAHFARLALKSAQARRLRAAGMGTAS